MTARDYMKLPYNRVFSEMNDESGHYWFGTVLELDGCMTDGDTLEEAREHMNEAMEGWIETKIAGGFDVPLPQISPRKLSA